MDESSIRELMRLYFQSDSIINLRSEAISNAIHFSEKSQKLGYAERAGKWRLTLTDKGIRKMYELGVDYEKIRKERIRWQYRKILKEEGREKALNFLKLMDYSSGDVEDG